MRRRSATMSTAFAAAALSLIALSPSPAVAGEYRVASCQADRMNYSTAAFNDFATRGMTIRRACNPEGEGMRGLVTANATRSGAVPRGAVAMAAISAPEGTRFTTFRWAGSMRRRDCRYSLQLYAEGPGIPPVSLRNVRANRHCPGRARAQAAAYRSRTFNVAGATRIVQRVICEGGQGRRSCSARAANYVRTYQAEVGIADTLAPSATVLGDTPLGSGAWVSGSQPLNYDAADNVGIRNARVLAAGQAGGFEDRQCSLATPGGAFAAGVPCPNGASRMTVDTKRFPEGTHQLVVEAQDTAGNVGTSAPVAARVDNTPPARIDAAVDGGDGWRNRNDFAVTWTNPAEGDRAPIVAAMFKLCGPSGGSCTEGEQAGEGVSRISLQAPGPGEWKASVWRRDAAGNADQAQASEPVILRYDPEPPHLAFDAPSASDPTRISVQIGDKVSGIADGAIEISQSGSGTWQTLAAQREGDRLVARLDDGALPAGTYELRARAQDQARNEASTTQRADGQPMTLTLPLRIVSGLQAGIQTERVVRETVRRNGRRRIVRRRVTELRPSSVVPFGGQTSVTGRLANRDGQGIAGAEIQVFAAPDGGAEQLAGVVHTDAAGNYTYTSAATMSRTLRFAYAGSPLILPASAQVRLDVPAASTLTVSRRRVLNGQSVQFSGTVQSQPIPAGGKLVQLEVQLSRRWQTFRTARTDAAGRWTIPYRFARTRGIQRYRFRVKLPPEAGYPFIAGASRSLTVRVRGQR